MGGRAGLEYRVAATLAQYPALAPWQRRILGTLLALPPEQWRVFVRAEWPNDPLDAAFVLVGPPGVFVVALPASPGPVVVDAPVLAAAHRVERLLAERGLSPVAVRAAVVGGGDVALEQRPDLVLAGQRFVREVIARAAVLSPARIDDLAGRLATGYRPLQLAAPQVRDVVGRAAGGSRGWLRRVPNAQSALVDAEAVAAAQRSTAPASLEEWLSFLDPRQLDLVRRDYQGPARISGPAGTGKTVVALHRMAWLARRRTGRLLYVTFAHNLPLVAAAAYRRMAPESAPRAEFSSVHAWARDLLLRRGVRCDGDSALVESAFAAAWAAVGVRGPLVVLAGDPAYWREEIDHVIKGGGVRTLEEYLCLPRTGRRLRLDRTARTAMWRMYEEYERVRRDAGAADGNDLLLAAAAELERCPHEVPYDVVVADEAQDLNLVGLRLLHALVGDRPNGLLLVGDGEQAVYPAASSLAEAGIPIQGRGEILRVNYRNAAEVLAVARELDAVNRFDDGGAPGLRDVEATLSGGAARHYTATTAEDHDVELVTALRTCPVGPGDIALLTSTPEDASHYRQVLHAAQIPAVSLADYAGRRIDAVKVDTIRRAKGLEFRAVFLPGHGRLPGGDEVGVREALVGLTRARDYLWTGSVIGA